MTQTRLLIKITVGTATREDTEKVNQAFNVASIALASGVPVSVWLAGESSWLAVPGRAEQVDLPLAAPLADLIAAVLAQGTLTICGQCAARRDLTEADLLPGARIAGATVLVEEIIAEGTKVMVY